MVADCGEFWKAIATFYGEAANIFGDPQSSCCPATLANDGNPVSLCERICRKLGCRAVQNTLHRVVRMPLPAVCCPCTTFHPTKHSGTGLDHALTEIFGDATLSLLDKSVIVPAYDTLGRRPVAFFRFAESARPAEEARPDVKTGCIYVDHTSQSGMSIAEIGTDGSDLLLRDLARGSSAGPTYLPPGRKLENFAHPIRGWTEAGPEICSLDMQLVDGGVWQNNPCALGVQLALLQSVDLNIGNICALSIGTGKQRDPSPFGSRWGDLWAAPGKLFGILSTASSDSAHVQSSMTLGTDIWSGIAVNASAHLPYLRVQMIAEKPKPRHWWKFGCRSPCKAQLQYDAIKDMDDLRSMVTLLDIGRDLCQSSAEKLEKFAENL